jgi:hypothetical protein
MTLVVTTYDRAGKQVNRFETGAPFYMNVAPLDLWQGGRIEVTHGSDRPCHVYVQRNGYDQRIFN